MIVVTGASGQLGRAVVERLIERVGPANIGVSVRDTQKAEDLAKLGVRVRQGDFTDAESLSHAFEGATQLLIVSSNAAATGGDPIAQHRTALAAARSAGVQRVLYTSHMGASPTSAFAPCRDHATTEAMLQASGLRFTVLRNGFYAATVMRSLNGALESGELVAPKDGPVSWTAHADLAEAIAVILAEEGRFEGPTPPLTGSEALDFAQVAAIASEVLQRNIKRVTQSDDAFRAGLVARGLPGGVVDLLLGMYLASRAGEFAAVDPTLEKLIGRKPIPMREQLSALLAKV